MRNLFSIALDIIAGFFFYMVMCLSFINDPSMHSAKLWISLGFTIPALVFLCGGLALNGFRNWQKGAGIVLLSASGFMVFLVFTLACMLMTEEFRMLMKQETLTFFSDYASGGSAIIGFAITGAMLLKRGVMNAEQCAPADAIKPRS